MQKPTLFIVDMDINLVFFIFPYFIFLYDWLHFLFFIFFKSKACERTHSNSLSSDSTCSVRCRCGSPSGERPWARQHLLPLPSVASEPTDWLCYLCLQTPCASLRSCLDLCCPRMGGHLCVGYLSIHCIGPVFYNKPVLLTSDSNESMLGDEVGLVI